MKRLIVFGLTSVSTLLFPVIALAQRPDPTVMADKIASRAAQRATSTENKCEAVNRRINAHLNNLNTRKDNHVQVYRAAYERWVKLADRLAAKGLDVTQLRTDLNTLKSIVDQLETDYADFVSRMTTTLSTDCTADRETFKNNLAAGREELSSFRQRSHTIREFIRNTIRKDLTALRQQRSSTENQ